MWLKINENIMATILNTDYYRSKQPERNVEYFNILGSIDTKYARCTQEIKTSIANAKAVFN
jgi:hypothetical protein